MEWDFHVAFSTFGWHFAQTAYLRLVAAEDHGQRVAAWTFSARRWVGEPAPDSHRNPATYFVDTSGGAKTCACGCGETIPVTRVFAPGHDPKAVHERITRRWGGVLGFIRWFDEAYPNV